MVCLPKMVIHPTTNTHPFNGPFSGTTQVSRYQKGNTNLDFCEARDSEWQWHQLGHMQVYTSLQTDNHASTPLLSFFTGRMPFCRPTNSVKALKALQTETIILDAPNTITTTPLTPISDQASSFLPPLNY